MEKEADLNWPLPSRAGDREGQPCRAGSTWESSLGVKSLDRGKVPCKGAIGPVEHELTPFGRGAFADGSKLRILRQETAWTFPGPQCCDASPIKGGRGGPDRQRGCAKEAEM